MRKREVHYPNPIIEMAFNVLYSMCGLKADGKRDFTGVEKKVTCKSCLRILKGGREREEK